MTKFDDLQAAVTAALAAASTSVAHAVTVMNDAASELVAINNGASVGGAAPSDVQLQALTDTVNQAVPGLQQPLDTASIALSAAVRPLV